MIKRDIVVDDVIAFDGRC